MTSHSGAGALLWQNWQQRTRIDCLPDDCRPADRPAGYAAQREIIKCSGQRVAGWKIAATSPAGQKHIGVDGPLAGPILAGRVLPYLFVGHSQGCEGRDAAVSVPANAPAFDSFLGTASTVKSGLFYGVIARSHHMI